MTPERWQRIGDLFEEALALPADERSAMIDRVAATDKQVRREVLSLLASHHAAPRRLRSEAHSVSPSSRFIARAKRPARAGARWSVPVDTRAWPWRYGRRLSRGAR